MTKFREYTKEWIEELCKESFSFAEVTRKAGRKGSGSQTHLTNKIREWEIDTSHFTGQAWSKGKTKDDDLRICRTPKYTIEEIFIENSPVARGVIRDYVLRNNLIEYLCSSCGNVGEWLGETMSLELDHINGISDDHRLENLRWLCPNCHAITATYSGKNNKKEIAISKKQDKNLQIECLLCKKIFKQDLTHKNQKYCSYECSHKASQKAYNDKYDIDNREQLKNLIRENSFLEVGRIFGVSDNAIRKYCIKHKLPSKKSEIKQYSNDEWKQI